MGYVLNEELESNLLFFSKEKSCCQLPKYHVGFNKHSLTRVTNFREKTMKETMKLNAQSSLILQCKIVGNTKDTMKKQGHIPQTYHNVIITSRHNKRNTYYSTCICI